MSQYPPTPPSYGGPPNNTMQWPPSGLTHTPFHQPPANTYQHLPENPNRAFEYAHNEMSFNANARLPGLGTPGATGLLPPHSPFPFMGALPPMQFPTAHFPGAPLPPPGTGSYQPMPLPAAPIHAPPQSIINDLQTHSNNNTLNDTRSDSIENIDREEGELSDQEGSFSRLVDMTKAQTEQSTLAHRSTVPAKMFNRRSSDLEEGETSSLKSRSSSRESGSPYNPELPIDATPIAPALNNLIETGSQSKLTTDSLSDSAAFLPTLRADNTPSVNKSPAQLRVQAQGALLSLAPHNIRYHELVAEGINPSVLKRLYEGVGIKIASPPPEHSASVRSNQSSTDTTPVTSSPVSPETQKISVISQPSVAGESGLVGTASSQAQPPSAPTQSSKPMERKEVIARMLAAKAAKSSGPSSASPQTEVAAPAARTESVEAPGLGKNELAASSEESTKEKEGRVREKNKAQTELARQRIEQLKKQGLVRAQQKAQAEVISDNAPAKNDVAENSTTSSAIAPIQHPLPDRPPEPEAQAPASIPGLFMMDSAPTPSQESFVTPVHGLVVDATPQPRTNQRKRPRASDFDEPVSVPKRSLSNGANHTPADERLIIDISDDELYEDEDDYMDIDESPESTLEDADQSIRAPQRSMTSSSQFFSSSATPQYSRNNHPEDLKRRDLEIQAMHRRIAELEQRKKAKQTASRTQSPRGVDSAASTPGHVSAAEVDISDALDLPAGAEVATRTPSAQSYRLSLLRPDELEHMKLKLLRKQEIESGIPVLEAEIQRSEARLSGLQDEEEHVLLEITRGKQGRQQLLQELSSLDFELNGLTLREVEEELHKVKNNEHRQVPDDGSIKPQDASNVENCVRGQDSEVEAKIQTPVPVPEPADEVHQPSLKAPDQPAAPVVDDDAMDEGDSTSDVSTPSSSDSDGSSAMSESSDSDSDTGSDSGSNTDSDSDSDSEDSEGSEAEVSGPQPPTSTTVNAPQQPENAKADANIRQGQPSEVAENQTHSLPERPALTNVAKVDNAAVMALGPHEQDVERTEEQASDEESDSEAYEPPEPEATAESSDSDYIPPSNPPSPGPVDLVENSGSPLNQDPHAGELLTGNVQEVESSDAPRNGILENPPVSERFEHKFSPYVSPLKNFRAYRYHPNYTSGVADGYRSLTYSHDIDAMKYLCPFEAAGGVCNDRSCEFQHFRDMTLSDDKILVQMGSLREGNTPEEKDNYVTGLKEMVNELRRDKVKDFNTVATEIAAYRRRYLQDPSRILPL